MHQLKQKPEDFIVTEIPDYKTSESGRYSYFLLKKTNYNTTDAIKHIANKLKIHPKTIGFAGNKDKHAITTQLISIKKPKEEVEKLKLKDIELTHLGKGEEEIYLGKLKGNQFEITIRNLDNEQIKKIETKAKQKLTIPNLYGPQRFSHSNHKIGKALIQNNFKECAELIIATNSDKTEQIKNHLQKSPNDYITAIKKIPLSLLKLYIHAYQSELFNKTIEKLSENIQTKNIPLIGFSTQYENKEVEQTIKEILKQDNISERDFIFKQIPELSMEGDERQAYLNIADFKIKQIENDELNQNKKKTTVTFSLPKGSFATTVIDQLLMH